MPTFCRHNRLLQNCTICAREQHFDVRPIVSGGERTAQLERGQGGEQAQRQRAEREPSTRSGSARSGSSRERSVREQQRAPSAGRRHSRGAGAGTRRGGVRVRRLARASDDGFRSALVPGVKSSVDAERLAGELAFSAARLDALRAGADGPWRELSDPAGEIEERAWLAFLIAYIGPDDSDMPFAQIEAARTSWSSAEAPRFERVRERGPRGAFDPPRAAQTVSSYRTWVARAGSQQAAFTGEPGWSAERRFERTYERLALPGMTRDARFELLTLLGESGVFELHAGMLALGGENEVTWAAKRVFGIGEPALLERRAAALASACSIPLEALDLALYNWGSGTRCGVGLSTDAAPDAVVLEGTRAALSL